MLNTSIIAHRGMSQAYPENTLLAFEMAIDSNCDGIEFDVQLSKDLIPVIVHDETIDRTTNGKGYICNYNLDQLKMYNFGINFNYENIPIPTLDEFLKLIVKKNYSKLLNIEIKNDIVNYPNIEDKLLSLVLYYNLQDQVLFSSFNHQSMTKMRKLSKSVNIALLYNNETPDLNQLLSLNAYSAHFNIEMITKELVESLQNKNFKTLCYTANSPADIQKLLDMKVDGIFTDNPNLACEIVYDNKNAQTMCCSTF